MNKTFYIILFLLTIFYGNIVKASADLQIPRFVSLKSDSANARFGPGAKYDIKWQYVKKNMPIEIIAEFEDWRKVRDVQGDEAWLHRAMLSGRRTAIITNKTQFIREKPSEDSKPIAKLEVGVSGILKSCQKDYCLFSIRGYEGWIGKRFIWGAYKDETF